MLFYTWFLFAAVWHQLCIHLSVGNQIVVAFAVTATEKDSLRGKVYFVSCSRMQSITEGKA